MLASNILVLVSCRRGIDRSYVDHRCFHGFPFKAYSASFGPKHRRYKRLKDFLYKTSSMNMYLAAQILNFIDFESISIARLFKYSIIGLLQSRASIVITSSFVVLGRLSTSTKIPFIAFGSIESTRESLSTLVFFSREIYTS